MATFSPRGRGDREHQKFGKDNTAADSNPVFVMIGGTDGSTYRALKIDAVGNIGTGAGATSVGTGRLTLTTANTSAQIASNVACRRVFIQNHAHSSGVLVVGDTHVVAAPATRRGKLFYATQGDWFNVSNINVLYADGDTSSTIIHYLYEV